MSLEPAEIDDLDRRLVERLRIDGRESNRALARALGVNEATIASRLRRLESGGTMRVVALTDMEAFGFELLAFVLVDVAGRPTLDVAPELAQIPETISVTVSTGRYDIVMTLLARDRAELGRLVGERIPAIAGIASVRCELAVDVLRYDSKWASLRADVGAAPARELDPGNADELDTAMIRALQRDARSSNRSIAAELGVSEGTVRARLRRMEDERRIHIQAISDVETFGLRAHAFIGVHVAGGEVAPVGRDLLACEDLLVVARSIGEFDYVAVIAASTREQLVTTVLDRIERIPHVRATETFESCATVKHAYTWARIV